jgi:two-component system, response regulator PdtaR
MTSKAEASSSGVVLIVEDDVLLRLITASSLRQAGFEVLEAANAAEASRVLSSVAVDALISDVNMPGRMNGLELAQWIHRRGLDTRIILTSGESQSLGEVEQYASFLAEPYDSEEVQQLLRQVLRN